MIQKGIFEKVHYPQSILSNFLPPLKPPNKVETKRIKSAGVVLTSRENLEIMNERSNWRLNEKKNVKGLEKKKQN